MIFIRHTNGRYFVMQQVGSTLYHLQTFATWNAAEDYASQFDSYNPLSNTVYGQN